MKQYKDISLKPYNTFGIDHKAHLLIETSFEDEVIEAISTHPSLKVLGGGSNILLTKDIETPLLRMTCKGVTIEQENEDYILIKAQAGENWSEFVDTCVAQGYGGVENLSLIYGSVGAAPLIVKLKKKLLSIRLIAFLAIGVLYSSKAKEGM